MATLQEEEMSYDFPIEEVRLTVPPTDDTTLPVLTFRTWILGLSICCILAFADQFFIYRKQTIYISTACVDILILIAGKLMASKLPNKLVKVPGTRWMFSLNPGPFQIKEHVLISILANAGNYPPLAMETITISKIFYHRNIRYLPGLLLILSNQLVGYGFAGMFMNFLVRSPYMWFPDTLVSTSFYRAMHVHEERQKGQITRFQFFLIAAALSFAYSIVPNYFFPSLTALSFVCWIWKDSITAQQIGSGFHGLGLGSFGLDWFTMSSFTGSPMASPISLIVSTMAGFILYTYVLIPISYWTNAFNSKRFPIASSDMFDDKGQAYNVSHIMHENFQFNEDAYNNYSKLYLSALLVYRYGFHFASFTSIISHTALFYGRSIWTQFRDAYKSKEEDVHTRLMKKYDSVPQWWYSLNLFSMIGLAIFTCEVYKEQFQLSYWGVLLASAILFVLVLPNGILLATANSTLAVDVILQVVISYLDPGKPIGNLTFTNYGVSSMVATMGFISEFKLGHYLKIPPKPMFLVQILGITLGSLINFGVAWWLLGSIKNICHPDLLPKGSPWTCPGEWADYNSGVTFGLVGPKRMFYPSGTYSAIFIFFIIGLLAPVPVWILSRMYPEKKWISLINFPIMFSAGAGIPPASPVNYWSWCIVAMLFNYVVFQKYKGWWAKYNYVLSAALDAGTALMALVASLTLNLEGVYGVSWWGLDMDDHCPLATCPTSPGIVVEGCPIIN